MGVIRGERSICCTCKHYEEKQVDQFGYEVICHKDAPDAIFLTLWGCYKYKKRKKGDRYR